VPPNYEIYVWLRREKESASGRACAIVFFCIQDDRKAVEKPGFRESDTELSPMLVIALVEFRL